MYDYTFAGTIIALLFIINMAGFVVAGLDKYRARKGFWRIPERTFFWIALLGGSPGVYSGLLLFRHKTRHWYFMIGIPLIFLIQVIGIYYLLNWHL